MKLLKYVLVGGLGGLVYFCGAPQVFAAAHSAGTNVISNGTIYMITNDSYRRPYTSEGAFLSYGFNSWGGVQQASAEDLAMPVGAFIPPRDGKIVCSDRGTDKGTCYLITNGKRAGFVSETVFKALGFSFGKALYGDVSFLEKDADISNSSDQHRSGVLINKNGTIYLVSPTGVMGIPSMDVLSTWGYSDKDVVTANSSDSALVQVSVIAKRQGSALAPSATDGASNSGSLYQGYIDTYPDLPTATMSAPQDGAAVIDLVNKIENLPGSDFSVVYPYLTSQSVEMLTKLPDLKKFFESSTVHLAGMSPFSSKIDVYEGGTQALYVQTKIQLQTSYKSDYNWVAKKENGVWKWDILGDLKYNSKQGRLANPNNVYTTGTGTDDVMVKSVFFGDERYVNDPNTWMYAEIKNNGQTTIKKFSLLVYFNNIIMADDVYSYEMQPGQSMVLAIPLGNYWTLSGPRKTAGSYTSEVRVGLGVSTNEVDVSNNKYTYVIGFTEKPASPVPTN